MKVSQKSHKRLSIVSQKSHKSLPKVSQKSLKSVSKVSQKPLKSLAKVSQLKSKVWPTHSLTRSPIELSWTAKKITKVGCRTIGRVKYSPFLKIQSANPCQSGGLTVSAVFWIGLGLADWTGLTWIGMPRWGVANACQFGPISQSWANPKPIEAPIWIGRAEANPVFSMPIHENAEANPEPMLA